MVRVFITGSSDGIGQAAAKLLANRGHEVLLHARNDDRAREALKAVPNAMEVVIGDLSSMEEISMVAGQAECYGPFDAIVHNAGIGYGSTSSRVITADNISKVFAVNTLAPYMMTCLMNKPSSRILFMSSDSHWGGDGSLQNATQSHSYGDSKLHDVMLAKAFARRWDGLQCISMHPGWVRTKMGGSVAPGSVDSAAEALAGWVTGESPLAQVRSGAFVTTSGEASPHEAAEDVNKQELLLRICQDASGISIPE